MFKNKKLAALLVGILTSSVYSSAQAAQYQLVLDYWNFDGSFTGPKGSAYEFYDNNVTPPTAQAAQNIFDGISQLTYNSVYSVLQQGASQLTSQTGINVDSISLNNPISGPLNVTIGPIGSSGQNVFSMSGITMPLSVTMKFSKYEGPVELVATCYDTVTVQPGTTVSGNYDAASGVLSGTLTTLVSVSNVSCDAGIDGIYDDFVSITKPVPDAIVSALNQTWTINWNFPSGTTGSLLGLSETLQTGTYSTTAPSVAKLTPATLAQTIGQFGAVLVLNPLLPDRTGQTTNSDSGDLPAGVPLSVQNVSISISKIKLKYIMNEAQSYYSTCLDTTPNCIVQ